MAQDLWSYFLNPYKRSTQITVYSLDNICVVAGIQLFQQRDLPQSGHGHSIVVQRDPNFLQRHYITGDHISGSVNRSIST